MNINDMMMYINIKLSETQQGKKTSTKPESSDNNK